jgi:hypothetical protein
LQPYDGAGLKADGTNAQALLKMDRRRKKAAKLALTSSGCTVPKTHGVNAQRMLQSLI